MQSQMREKKRQSGILRSFRYWFEVDEEFARLEKYLWFRRIGLFLNAVAAVGVGVLLHNWLLGVLCLLSVLAFFLCIRLVRTSWAMALGLLLAVYWGAVGWVVGVAITSFLNSSGWLNSGGWLPIALSCGSFLISALLHFSYVRNRIP